MLRNGPSFSARWLRLALAVAVAACSGSEGAPRPAGDERPSDGRGSVAPADTTLQRMAGELLPEVETLSGLRARRPLRLSSRSRADLEAYLVEELGRQLPPERVRSLVRVYARFGLVPDTIDLEPLLRSLFLEQVVGYYDPVTDTLFVVEGVEARQIEPVLAHEMVHALQDQYMDLDSLMSARREHNDAASAAQAALEGHATFVMLEWQLRRLMGSDTDLAALPNLSEALGADPLAAVGMEMPVLREAPAVIRESVLFPYVGGLGFVQELWRGAEGRKAPLGREMPSSTEQVLHPERFAAPNRDRPTAIRFVARPGGGWSEVTADGLGELEVRVFLREYLADEARADSAAAGWDGDRYRLLEGPEGEGLVWASVWDGPEDAAEFAAAVRDAFERRYADAAPGEGAGRRVRVERMTVDDRETVLVRDAPPASPPGALDGPARFRLGGP